MGPSGAPYDGTDLARVHHAGFGFHADACAEGILALLAPVRTRDGVVLELGCGSGALTRHLVAAGHRVVATDASRAMLELAQPVVAEGAELRPLVLPDDPLPAVDAVVSVGHALNYLPDEAAIERALVAIADALRPGGILAIDLCDLRWGEVRREQPDSGKVGDDWAIVTESSVPRPDRFVREITTFVRNDDGTWRRGHERHDNVLMDTSEVPELLARHGMEVTLQSRLGGHTLPEGLVAIVGERPAAAR
jgi:SAM-dependent methyltransferase